MKAMASMEMTSDIVEDGVKMRTIGFLSKNQLDGTLLDIASIASGYTTVPLYDSFGVEALEFIINNVKCETIFVDGIDKQVQTVKKLFEKLGNANPIKFVVFSNNLSKESRDSISELTAKIMTCEELLKVGQESTLDVDELVDKSEDLEHIAVVM